ncbi:MAG TPA: hypothetical protein VHY82_07600 [Acetobacteraceae bacterium]|nr:hypothetical protein [Acetobacteraceae bacterium]
MFRLRTLLVAGTLALGGLLGGCVYYPAGGYYGGGYGGYYGGPYYGGAAVAYGDGWHHGWWHRDRDWYR